MLDELNRDASGGGRWVKLNRVEHGTLKGIVVDVETGEVVMKSVEKLVAMKDGQIDSLDAQVQSLARRVTDVEERLSKEQKETRRLRRWIGLLLDQIRALGVEPIAEPTE